MQNQAFNQDSADIDLGVKYTKNDCSEITINDRKSATGNGSASGHASVLSAHNIDYWVKVSGGCCKSADKQILTNIR